MPFIAITERAFRSSSTSSIDVLERGIRVHERLERLVIEGRGLREVTGAIWPRRSTAPPLLLDGAAPRSPAIRRSADLCPGAVGAIAAELAELLEPSRRPPASSPSRARSPAARVVVPVPVGGAGRARSAGCVAARRGRALGDFERLIARQAAMVVALELMRERIVRETERRLAGDLLADALSGRLDAEELRGRLRPFGIGANAAVAALRPRRPAPATPRPLEAALRGAGVPAARRDQRRPPAGRCSARSSTPASATRCRARAGRPQRCSRPRPQRPRRRQPPGARSARCAAPSTRRAARSRPPRSPTARAPEVASHRDLGAFTLLLALQDDDALRLYSEDLLEPIERGEGEYGGELLRSLEAFIENNGQLGAGGAAALYCHRHTLRYRIRKIEELTGRDLSRATDRIELWLALRARELVR